jgi:TonB family protein
MNGRVQSLIWSRRRSWSTVLGLSALQIALLYWFSARGPVQPRPAAPAPRLRWAGAAAGELLALGDPTLFAQSHAHGFSGAPWMRIPVPEYQAPAWSEPPRWLALDAPQLGADFHLYVQTNQPVPRGFSVQPEAQLAAPDTEETAPATAAPSALRIEGALAARHLRTPPRLRAWEHTDLLTNSVVQVLVNADGDVVSSVLIRSSGLTAADDRALAVARAAQFSASSAGSAAVPSASEPLLTFGILVFEWQTLPLPATNAPPTTS